jgi:hypothetical protein
LLSSRESAILVVAAFVARAPMGMIPVAILLGVTSSAGVVAAALTAGAYEFGSALGGVGQSWLIDRTRQTPFLLFAACAQPLALLSLALATRGELPVSALGFLGFLAGAVSPQVTGSLRAIWGGLEEGVRRVAFSLDAVVVEAVFVVGPAFAALLVAAISSTAALAAAAILSCIGTLVFALQDASRRWRGQRSSGAVLGPWSGGRLRLVLAAAALFGLGDGAFQVAVLQLANRLGHIELAGVVFTVFSIASVLGGLGYGLLTLPGSPAARLTTLQLAMAAIFAVATLISVHLGFIAVLIASGAFLAPLGIETSILVGADAPAGTTTEAFAWLVTVVSAGNAAGLTIAGSLQLMIGPNGLAALAAAWFVVAAIAAARLAITKT